MKNLWMVRFLNEKDNEEKIGKNPIWYLVLVFLLLIIVLWVVPYSGINKNPRPIKTISLREAIQDLGLSGSQLKELDMKGTDTENVLIVARRIGNSCNDVDNVCYTKAFYYFVRDEIKYIPDPVDEFYEAPEFTLKSGSADCDGKAILLSALLRSVGIQTRLVLVPNHIFVQAYLPGALSVYKSDGDWVSLDATSNEDIGYSNPKDLKNIKGYIFF